jgi:hypothetical protein
VLKHAFDTPGPVLIGIHVDYRLDASTISAKQASSLLCLAGEATGAFFKSQNA